MSRMVLNGNPNDKRVLLSLAKIEKTENRIMRAYPGGFKEETKTNRNEENSINEQEK